MGNAMILPRNANLCWLDRYGPPRTSRPVRSSFMNCCIALQASLPYARIAINFLTSFAGDAALRQSLRQASPGRLMCRLPHTP